MRKPLRFLIILTCITLVGVAWAGPRSGSHPHRFQPESLDSGIVQSASPLDGSVHSAWAYRNGAEYDIAISTLEEDGDWSEPVFLGGNDGIDQLQPALASDEMGNLYLAFVQGNPGRVLVTVLTPGSSNWTTPVAVSALSRRASAPSIRVVGSRLVLAYRSGRDSVEILDFPLTGPGTHDGGFTDGPDPVGAPPKDNPRPGDDKEDPELTGSTPTSTVGYDPSGGGSRD